MLSDSLSDSLLFGYLTVVDDPAHGLCGGYLVINQLGRPVEFHCSAAISPNRAQQILYGPTLRAALYGEQVAPALVSKAKSAVAVVFVNQRECVELQRHTGQCVVLIDEPPPANISNGQLYLIPDLFDETPLVKTKLTEEVRATLSLLAESIDLAEPFERIREAIYEAQQIGGEGQVRDARAA